MHALLAILNNFSSTYFVSEDGDLYFGDISDEKAASRSSEQVSVILRLLHSCCLHDCEAFLTNDVVTQLEKPLVDQVQHSTTINFLSSTSFKHELMFQLENFVGGIDVFQTRIVDDVVPCITQLAVAARSDLSCKSLNYQICLKMRHDAPKV